MIYWPAVFLATCIVALWLLFVALFPWQVWEDLLRRGAKYVRVTWGQMDDAARQQYAMGAGIVVWYVVWSVAIVKGW
jgi:lauroyl/myristoyl acyltransferase